ncbi:TIGR00266 family protein [Limnoglobus roseus]|uniref:TIGR00266 family protein n=1 Tax=Limnoglobus roseus TaxID=2598579 RepID=A0A5C1AF69_9BACT|nr:TIGR00266 family protein [Limnoglobus roseus]QEL17901.1 hypothetical protein PX52LOC_04913 [Limnoglobus roseus]
MRCDEIDYEILGDDIQLVEITLDPDETVIAEAGVMNYMEDGITFQAKMGDGSKPQQGFFSKLGAVGKRVLTGESLFMTHFTNEGKGRRKVGFAAPYPGRIIPLDLSEHDEKIICEKGAFLCAAFGTEIGIHFRKKLGVGLFGGEGFILQKLEGDGLAFLHSGGTIIERELRDGEILRLDTGCLVAMEQDVEYNIERAGSLKSMFFGGEGMFLATLEGPGKVWIQTLPFSRLCDRIIASAPSAGGSSKGEGSILGGVGRLFGGD